MQDDPTNKFRCNNCNTEVNCDDDYCYNCGTLFIENELCHNHDDKEASGVCLICGQPYCTQCIDSTDPVCLCMEHSSFEIMENMVRVFGSSDEVAVHFAEDCVKKAGFHPFVFSRKASPLHLGGADYSLFRAAGDSQYSRVNEYKLMVPFNETLSALEVLRDAEII